MHKPAFRERADGFTKRELGVGCSGRRFVVAQDADLKRPHAIADHPEQGDDKDRDPGHLHAFLEHDKHREAEVFAIRLFIEARDRLDPDRPAGVKKVSGTNAINLSRKSAPRRVLRSICASNGPLR